MPSEYWRRLREKPHAAWPLIGLYIKPLGELPATSSLQDIFPSGLHMLWNNLLVTAAHNSCKQLPLLKMWLNSPHYYYANIHSAFEFFFLIIEKDDSILFGCLHVLYIFSVFFFFWSINLGTILNPLHTKPAELLFHFSCLSSFHLAAVELGRNHARLFGLAVNSAITHAKTENLTFVISLLLRPICSRQTRREARVEEKEKPVLLLLFFFPL